VRSAISHLVQAKVCALLFFLRTGKAVFFHPSKNPESRIRLTGKFHIGKMPDQIAAKVISEKNGCTNESMSMRYFFFQFVRSGTNARSCVWKVLAM